MYPKKVKFIGSKANNTLYQSGLKKNKTYETIVDDEYVLELFEKHKTVTVLDDDFTGHEIEDGDYEIK